MCKVFIVVSRCCITLFAVAFPCLLFQFQYLLCVYVVCYTLLVWELHLHQPLCVLLQSPVWSTSCYSVLIVAVMSAGTSNTYVIAIVCTCMHACIFIMHARMHAHTHTHTHTSFRHTPCDNPSCRAKVVPTFRCPKMAKLGHQDASTGLAAG